ncbi:hypothetical protein D9M73_258260 [compost metagenome]
MGQSHGDMGIEQADRRIQLEKRQEEDRRWRHAVGQQPEKQMLVAQKPVTGKRVGRRQGHAQRNHRVKADVVQRIDVAGVPARVGKNHPVVVQREMPRP